MDCQKSNIHNAPATFKAHYRRQREGTPPFCFPIAILRPTIYSVRMARLHLTPNLKRHVDVGSLDVPSGTLREALDAAFAVHPALRGYVLDDQGHIRKHMVLFIDDRPALDRSTLSDLVGATSEIWVFQALSGG